MLRVVAHVRVGLNLPAKAYLVGGAVRDLCLGRKPVDYDFVGPNPQSMAMQWAQNLVGSKAFALDEERDYWRVVHQGLHFDFAPLPRGLEADLLRRDYSINSLAVSSNGAVLGPPIARYDLHNRLLRAQTANLYHDPLRSLRGIRLATTHGLKFEPTTYQQLIAHAQHLLGGGTKPAWERVREELQRTLMSPYPAKGFRLMQRLGLLQVYLPELAAGVGVEQRGYHLRTVFDHSLDVLQELVSRFPHADLALRWAALLHDVAKPQTRAFSPEKGRFTFYGHEAMGKHLSRQILERLRYPNHLVERVSALVGSHMQRPPKADGELRRYMHKLRPLLPQAAQLVVADFASICGLRSQLEPLLAALQRLETMLQAEPPIKPLLDGRAVMRLLHLSSGSEVGRALAALKLAQAEQSVATAQQAERFLLERFGPIGPSNGP